MSSRDLATFRNHARKMADAPGPTPGERALWRQLAAEVDQYLAADGPPAEPETEPEVVEDLFGDPAVEPPAAV